MTNTALGLNASTQKTSFTGDDGLDSNLTIRNQDLNAYKGDINLLLTVNTALAKLLAEILRGNTITRLITWLARMITWHIAIYEVG